MASNVITKIKIPTVDDAYTIQDDRIPEPSTSTAGRVISVAKDGSYSLSDPSSYSSISGNTLVLS